jgi:PAS domain S-box-containing protein
MLQTTFPLRSKIIMLVSGTAFCTALVIGGLNYYGISEIATDKAIEKLASETHLAALKVRSTYGEMKSDAFIIARAPTVISLLNSKRTGGIDPDDGATEAQLRDRLAAIFVLRLKLRPYYRQMRYIGLADNGREIVRVNKRADGAIETVAPEDMQQKGSEPYFQDGLRTPRNQYVFSPVTYNREMGKVDAELTPMLRIVIPVFDDEKTRLGMMVVDADYEVFLNEALKELGFNAETYVTDQQGTYMRLSRDGKISRLQVAENYSSPPPDFIRDSIAAKDAEGRFVAGDFIGYRHRLPIDPIYSDAAVSVLILVPKAELFASTNVLLNKSLTIGTVLILAASLAAVALGHSFTRPLARMTAQITTLGRDGGIETLDLPVHLRDEVGELARAFHELTDWLVISDAHRKKLSTQLDAFIATAVDGFVVIDGQGIIEQVNPALLTLFGYERDELLGKNVGVLMPEAMRHRHDEFLQAYQATGVRKYLGTIRDEEARHKDGHIFSIALSFSELHFEDRRIFTGIIRDMTAVRDAHRKIEHYATELERSNQELDQFAYVASHDLKAPLRVINNASRWLEEDLGDKLTGDDRENMTLLRNRVKRMEKLLDDLLEYSRLGKAEDVRYKETVAGSVMMDDLLLLLAPPPGRKVRFADAFKTISIYRMPLQQVLYNLINNAIKHHDRDEGEIEVDVARTEDGFRFSVRDDGPGIPAEFHERIFEMFHTLKPRDQVEGSGMGLAVVKKTVERFGGVITVASGGGRGTEFSFTWPIERQSSDFSEKAA